jgi:hypothetical protein
MWVSLALPLVACCNDVAWAQTQPNNLSSVSFESEILPMLLQHCVRCHGETLAAGDLRFDAGRERVVRGGQTGSDILGSSSADSELFRRITSTKPGYRMPKEGDALSAAQIGVVQRWLDQGAPWPSNSKPTRRKSETVTEQFGRHLADLTTRLEEPSFRNLFWLCVGFGVLALLGVLISWRRRRRIAAGLEMPTEDATWKNWVIGALMFLLLATWIHYDGKADSMAKEFNEAKKELFKYAGSPDDDPLEPPYPMHPKRLGGVYYRGNDERNEALFNGGFYRTAKLEVWLVDEGGTRLGWGDAVLGPLFVEFEIHRAAQTTGELFSDRVMSLIALTDSVSPQAEREVAQMECVTPGQVLKARLPIGQPESWPSGVNSGKLFLVQQTSKPKPHYGIVYEVSVLEGKIEDTSQLWMGSLYDLNGRVLAPRGDKILLDRWLDWRPIPEVEGTQTNDPKLLGVPEHL